MTPSSHRIRIRTNSPPRPIYMFFLHGLFWRRNCVGGGTVPTVATAFRNRWTVLFYPSAKRRICLTFELAFANSGPTAVPAWRRFFSLERGSRHEGADEDDQIGQAGRGREGMGSDGCR